jgi:hypothetical protein
MQANKKKTATRVPPTHAAKRTPAKAPRKQRHGRGVTRAIALRTMKRFGGPQERLQTRLKLEAGRDVTPLRIDEKLLKVREAAALLGISHHTLRSWALNDKVIYRRMGGLLMMIPESEVERLRSYGN